MFKEKLINHLQPISRKDELTNEIFNSTSAELTEVDGEITLTLNEYFVETATGPGLEAMEKRLKIVTDISKTVEHRRAFIIARLRSKRKISLSVIKGIGEAWSNGQIDTSIAGSQIKIKFISIGGIPTNLDDLKEVLTKLIPSHLSVVWEFSYLTWEMFENYNYTWNELEALNLSWDELEIHINQ